MRDNLGGAFKMATAALESGDSRVPAWWRAAGCIAAVLPFLFLVALASLRPDFNRPGTADWKSVLALANAFWENGDGYEARHLYLQVERIAAWHHDWKGLVAAACGVKRLDGARGPYSKAFQILLRALVAAQNRQSHQGVVIVAEAFGVLGEHKAAEMALAHIRSDWPAETEAPVENLTETCAAPR